MFTKTAKANGQIANGTNRTAGRDIFARLVGVTHGGMLRANGQSHDYQQAELPVRFTF